MTVKDDKPFIYKTDEGKEVKFRQFSRLPAGVFRKSRKEDGLNQLFALLEAGTDEAGLEVLDDLPTEELNHLLEQWTEAENLDAPKS